MLGRLLGAGATPGRLDEAPILDAELLPESADRPARPVLLEDDLAPQQVSGLTIAAFTLAFVSLSLLFMPCLWWLAVPTSLTALVLSFFAPWRPRPGLVLTASIIAGLVFAVAFGFAIRRSIELQELLDRL